MPKPPIPIAAMIKLMRKSSAERVSRAAAEELAYALQKEGIQIGKRALIFAFHAGRSTVMADDVKMVERERAE